MTVRCHQNRSAIWVVLRLNVRSNHNRSAIWVVLRLNVRSHHNRSAIWVVLGLLVGLVHWLGIGSIWVQQWLLNWQCNRSSSVRGSSIWSGGIWCAYIITVMVVMMNHVVLFNSHIIIIVMSSAFSVFALVGNSGTAAEYNENEDDFPSR